MTKYTLNTIVTLILILFICSGSWALEPPHDASNNINCIDCHGAHSGALISRGVEQEVLCKSCHNPTGQAANMSNVSNHMVNSGTMTVDCGSCHDPHKPMSPLSNPVSPEDYNLSLIRPNVTKYIENALEPAYFLIRPDDFAFLSPGPYNRICQACHTNTEHFRNDGNGPDQDHTNVGLTMGTDCTTCHTHENGFAHGGGGGTGCGSATECHGTQDSHPNHVLSFSQGGMLGVGCDECHDTNNFPEFKDGQPLSTTTVCNTCHSPDGSYDGVGDPIMGAKANWENGVYVAGLILSTGRDKWCAGCHDEVPSVINGVAAPNVIGDEDSATNYGIGYGYYKSGHGLPTTDTYPGSGLVTELGVTGAGMLCTACHDNNMVHVDGVARTYDASAADGANNDYQNGFRLKTIDEHIPLNIPREPDTGFRQTDFRLCFVCHDSAVYTDQGNTYTNYRDTDGSSEGHAYHLQGGTGGFAGNLYDSDWKDSGVWDSRISCPACHNVHGSTQLAMVRDGKLVNKEPGIPIAYYNDSVTIEICSNASPLNIELGDGTGTMYFAGVQTVCGACHGGCWTPYLRTPNSYSSWNDADEDGYTDVDDNCPINYNPLQEDDDGDGWGNLCDLCPGLASNINDISVDNDLDGLGDDCDLCDDDIFNDIDGDGICGDVDICPNDYENDSDGDGVCGDVDNCPTDLNSGQEDGDDDNVGDVCDNCPNDYNPDQTDTDGDGTGDACGPGTLILHPSDVVQNNGFNLQPSTDDLITILASNDGDDTYAYICCTSPTPYITVNIDDPSFPNGAVITNITIHALVKYATYPNGGDATGSVNIGYGIGTVAWQSAQTTISGMYTDLTFNPAGVDINNINDLQVGVKRAIGGSYETRITEVYVEVDYDIP